MVTMSSSQSLTLMVALDSVDPSDTTGGSSKEAGPSSSVNGEVGRGLVGAGVEGVVTVVTEAEPGEGRGKAGGNILKPGLFGEGIRAPGDRTRLACSSERDVRGRVCLTSSRRRLCSPEASQSEPSFSSLLILEER